MERNAFATTKAKSDSPAMFACAAMAASSILIIRALSLSLGVLLISVLCGILISLVLRLSSPLAERVG